MNCCNRAMGLTRIDHVCSRVCQPVPCQFTVVWRHKLSRTSAIFNGVASLGSIAMDSWKNLDSEFLGLCSAWKPAIAPENIFKLMMIISSFICTCHEKYKLIMHSELDIFSWGTAVAHGLWCTARLSSIYITYCQGDGYQSQTRLQGSNRLWPPTTSKCSKLAVKTTKNGIRSLFLPTCDILQ